MKRDIYKQLRDDVTGKMARQFTRPDPQPEAHPTNGKALRQPEC